MPDLRLLCVLAHPDDESLGCGFMLAKYSSEGVQTSLVTATRGEHGWQGNPTEDPGPGLLGRIRESELRAASKILGLHEITLLDYTDGDLDQANASEAAGLIAAHIRRIHPQVVVTFDPTGAYGHPDHIAISQLTLAAVTLAADSSYTVPGGLASHRVSKVYFQVDTAPVVELVREFLGEMAMDVDGVKRPHTPWPVWAVSARIDGTAYWNIVLDAIACHRTQVEGLIDALRRLPETHDPRILSVQTFYRAFSLVNQGRAVETDLFEGLR